MKYWKKLSAKEINNRIAEALNGTINFEEYTCLGIPASRLDEQLFQPALSYQQQSPLLQVYMQNPNHIGCHTLGDSELFFSGTQNLEKELIELIAVDLLKAGEHSCDGYVAAGGTEANLQAVWVYRNYFIQEYNATHDQIAIISSADTHYSVAKAANLLHLDCLKIQVDHASRRLSVADLERQLKAAMLEGKKYFIAIANMGTTMFGSVDDPDQYAAAFKEAGVSYFIHVDGAFGGFVYPVASDTRQCTFANPNVSSITLDAHKMLQAPYGTGLFIIRKGFMPYVVTKEAAYVNGYDLTISGSRSGANAVAVWLLLFSYGPFGWLEKINKLLYRTQWLCDELTQIGVRFFNERHMNIITIEKEFVTPELAARYGLVPDQHNGQTRWYKIVIMDHVDLDLLNAFLQDLKDSLGEGVFTQSGQLALA
jgi:glutamate/tyrosine decarboxylase-like PLP-dependent enzyme